MQEGGPIEVCRTLMAMRNPEWWSAVLRERNDPNHPQDYRISSILAQIKYHVSVTQSFKFVALSSTKV